MLNDDDMKKIDLKDIQRDKQTALDRLAALDRERGELEQVINELAVAERVVARLTSVDLPQGQSVAAPDGVKRKKPNGIPTIYVMVLTLFRETGEHWMEAQEIVQSIRDRWWPTAENNDISPTLWRLARMEKLTKSGTKYGLPPGARGPVKQLGEPGKTVVVQ